MRARSCPSGMVPKGKTEQSERLIVFNMNVRLPVRDVCNAVTLSVDILADKIWLPVVDLLQAADSGA